MPLNMPAIKIRQKDIDIYVTTMRAEDLLNNYSIDWWKRDDPTGYQRPLKDSRIREIKHYLLKEIGTFPTSVLANVRGELQVRTMKGLGENSELCEISIPEKSLWVIDGQHRVEGLRAATDEEKKFRDYPLIVSLFTLPDIYDEMQQFHIVNSRAKSVPTDLAQQHLFQMLSKIGLPEVMVREGERDAYGAYVIPVVNKLLKENSSPWKGKIQLADEPRKKPQHVIKQRPLADSIHFIIKERPALMKDLDKLTKLLKDYWNALADIFPTAFADPKNYTIQATTGTYSLHMVFPEIYAECEKTGDISKEGMKKVLERMFDKTSERLNTEINDAFWSKEIGVGNFLAQATSMKMIKALAQYFREALWEK